MVTVRSNQKQSAASSCVPSYRRISNWSLLVGIFLIVVVNSTWRKVPNVGMNGTIRTKQAKEIIYPLPDGTKDYNLVKENSTSFQGFSFYVMGDTPYRDWQEERLKVQIAEMKKYVRTHPERNLQFTVHVGDTQKVATTNCKESAYVDTSALLRKGPLPTLVTPGDNDWYDCPDREESFGFFQQYFGTLETQWHKKDYQVLNIQRWEDAPEFFVFLREGILFIGLHLINAPVEKEDLSSWNQRMKRNKEWVSMNVESYFAEHEIRGVVLLGHCLRSPRTRPFFLHVADHFVNITHRQNLPVLYLHGDGHDWDVDTKLSHQLHWKHFRDVQVDQGGLADPIIVDVAPQKNGKLKGFKVNEDKGDLEITIGRGLFRIDRQRGLYENPKDIPKA